MEVLNVPNSDGYTASMIAGWFLCTHNKHAQNDPEALSDPSTRICIHNVKMSIKLQMLDLLPVLKIPIPACFGRVAALDTLLASFPDLSVQGPRGETALIAACANNHYSVVEKLVHHARAHPDGLNCNSVAC